MAKNESELRALIRAQRERGDRTTPNPFDIHPHFETSGLHEGQHGPAGVIGVGGGGGVETEERPPNPFDLGLDPTRLSSGPARPEDRQTAGARFVRGLGRGAIHPVRSFFDTDELDDLGAAGMIGEFSGAALTFIPLFKGATLALRGVGLMKTGQALGASTRFLTPFGQTPTGVRAAQTARGSLAFAGFETFAGDSPSEAPLRFARGLAEGAAFEAGAMRVASAWRARARAKRWDTPTPTGTRRPEGPMQRDVPINPLTLKLEKATRPEGGDVEELVRAKVLNLAEDAGEGGVRREWVRKHPETGRPGWLVTRDPTAQQRQLHQTFMKIVTDHMPGGQVQIPGLTQREVLQLTKAADEIGNIDIVPFRPIKQVDEFNVWLVDRDRTLLRGDPSGATVEEIIEATKKRFTDLGLEFPENIPDGDPLGRYSPDIPLAEAATANDRLSTLEGISTVFHEIVHHITKRGVGDKLKTPPTEGVSRPLLADIINFARRDPQGRTLPLVANESRIFPELKAATLEKLTLNGMYGEGWSRPKASKVALNKVAGDPVYYNRPNELVSRMAELIFLDPDAARKVAPNASMLIGNLIEREAPAIRHLLSKQSRATININTGKWRTFGGQSRTTILHEGKLLPTAADKAQYGRTGWARGMRALHNGKDVEFVQQVKPTGRALIRDPSTGFENVVDLIDLQRPVLQTMARRNQRITKAVDDAIGRKPRTVPVNLSQNVAVGVGMVRRGIIDVEDYIHINTDLVTWMKGLPQATRDQIIAKHGQISVTELRDIRSKAEEEFLDSILDIMGSKGIVRRDNGLFEVYVRDPKTLQVSEYAESKALGAHIAGDVTTDRVLLPSTDDMLRQLLREEGVLETELEYFARIAEDRLGEQIRGVLDPEVQQVTANVQAAAKKKSLPPAVSAPGSSAKSALDDSADNVVARSGLESNRLSDGRVELRDSASKTVLGKFVDREDAARFASDYSAENVGPPMAKMPGITGHGGGGGPPKPQSQMFPPDPPIRPSKTGRGVEVTEALFFPKLFSALENIAKKFEHRGLGPAYTKIYLPAHNAMLEVQREIGATARESLGGRSFKDMFGDISKHLLKVRKDRYEKITGHVEALTKEEIRQEGGLLARAMRPNEIRVAEFIEKSGLENDIPRLMSADKLIDSAVTGQGQLQKTIDRLRRVELSEEAEELVRMFESMPKPKDRAEAMEMLGLTREEAQVIKIIRDSMKADKEKFSIYAVSRYASAPKLKKGFKDGRQQFAFENGLSKDELAVSRLVSRTLEAAFEDSGLDPRRHLSGYWPHLRNWTEQGFIPRNMQLEDDVMQWVSERFRSGELNVYETDPLLTVYKHVRGLYMDRHFSPQLPDINRALRGIQDKQARETMTEYIMELKGKPHESFERLQNAINETYRTVLGTKAPERLATDVINSLSATISAALIPFRPALVARNFFESALKVSPRTGTSHYMRALRYVVDRSTRREAFKMAEKGGAIRPGTSKLRSHHSAEDIFGAGGPSFIDRYLRIFDKGFEWYQSADDWGRAVAFHAQRLRVMDNLDDYVKGRIDMAQLKDRAKINTFDVLDQQIAEREIAAGNYDKAINHLGQVLSREVMTRYGYADHPAGWHSVQGRLLGQFGTWPVQYKDYVVQGLTRGSMKDRAEFAAIHSAMSGGIIAAGATVGVNLHNWTGLQVYSGGPMADLFIDVVKSTNGSDAEKALSRSNLYSQIPILGWMDTGNPRSIFLPGSYMLGDLNDAREAMSRDDIFEAVMNGASLRVMRADQKGPLDWLLDEL